MRSIAFSLALALLAAPALADRSPISTELGANGLKATEARLAALPAPTNEDLFALAGVRFLSGIETALQIRWQTGMRADWSELPILRLPIPENPAARPFQAADFITLLTTLDAQMEGSRTALAQLGDRPFALEIAMSDLWFDINMNSTRDEGEDVTSVASITLAGAGRITTVDVTAPTVRFDTADAAWLSRENPRDV